MKFILVLISILSLLGCVTTDSLEPGRAGSAKFTVAGKTYDEVWKSSIKVMGNDLTIVEKSKEQGYIKSERGVGIATWGEIVGVFISPANKPAAKYQVEVLSYKRSPLQISGKNWTQTVVTAIEAELHQ